MKEVVIVAGPNGSGKSTFATILMEETGYPFLNADEIEKELKQKQPTASPIAAGRLLFQRLQEQLDAQTSFIIESTLSGNYIAAWIKKLKDSGFKITIVFVFLENETLCIERIKERVISGGHFVPNKDVIRRYKRSINNFWNNYRFLADDWTVWYNTEEIPQQIIVGRFSDYKIIDNDYFNLMLSKL